MEYLEDNAMVLRCSIADGNMLPVTAYLGEVHVAAVDNRHSEFTWTTTYEPVGEEDDVRPHRIVRSCTSDVDQRTIRTRERATFCR